jgi:hypothetical protein
MSALTIAGATIRMDDDGRYCLNDLHRASGGNPKDQPAKFFAAKTTKALVSELQGASPNSERPVVTVNDGVSNGTYAAKELVYAYAMWISPKFHLRVIRAYDALVREELDRLNGLHFRAVRAELEFLQGVRDASRCGIGLRQWRDDKRLLESQIRAIETELQPGLPLN